MSIFYNKVFNTGKRPFYIPYSPYWMLDSEDYFDFNPMITMHTNNTKPEGKELVKLTVDYSDHRHIVLHNSNGDTYTSSSEDLIDFLHDAGTLSPSDHTAEKEEIDILAVYNIWCKETKRSGSVLVGSSIKEFFIYFNKQGYKITKEI